MKRILHITGGLSRRGTETYIMNLYREALKEGIQFDFLLFSDSHDGYYDEAVSMGARIFSVPARNRNPFIYYKSLDEFYKRHKDEYSAIHFSGCNWTTIAPTFLAKKHGIETRIVHCHSSSSEGWHNILFHKINKHLIPKIATHFLACSKEAATWGYGGTSAMSKAIVAINGIDLKKFTFSKSLRAEIRKEANVSKTGSVWGHIGGLEKVKNHNFLIELFAENLEKSPKSQLWIVGSGSLDQELKQKVKDLGITDNVIFWGQRSDAFRLLQGMDVFVMPSHFEGLPFVMLEAQASGLPIVASDAVSEDAKVLETTITISLSESKDKWLEIINNLIKSKDRSEGGTEMSRFNLTNVVKPVIEIYKDSMSTK